MSESERPPEELLVPAIGAAVFASGEPVHPREIADAFGGLDAAEVEAALDRLAEALDRSDTGLRVERVAGGVRLATRSDVGAWVRSFLRQRNRTRLSPAALETLAVIAYRQPVTAPEIQAIRGKDPSASLKTLLDKKLVRLLGKKKVVGNPLLYGTSRQFLIHFGLNSLEDLPSLEEFDEFVGVLQAGQESLFGAAADDAEADGDPSEADGLDLAPDAGPEEVSDEREGAGAGSGNGRDQGAGFDTATPGPGPEPPAGA